MVEFSLAHFNTLLNITVNITSYSLRPQNGSDNSLVVGMKVRYLMVSVMSSCDVSMGKTKC